MKKIYVNKKLTEAISEVPPPKNVIQLPRETALKRKVKAVLKDDGLGHYHSKFADRLDDFFIYIVDHKKNPDMTASICFDTATIKISDGFLLNINSNDKQLQQEMFQTLSVLFRHELLHNLLMHEIRMINHLGPDAAEHIGTYSQSINDLENIIMDMEISNRGYSAYDKALIRNLKLNTRIISGIVTEDLRPEWASLTLEQMYIKLLEEGKLIAEFLNNNKMFWGGSSELGQYKALYDYDRYRNQQGYRTIIDTLTGLTGYRDEQALEKLIYQPIDNFKLSKDYKLFKKSEMVKDVDDIIDSLADAAKILSQKDLEKLYEQIRSGNPVQEIELRNPANNNLILTVYTPEEKFLAAAVLHALIAFPVKKYWENRTEQVFTQLPQYTNYSKEDIEKIVAGIN